MVNRSKAADPRFWKRWRDSGAVSSGLDLNCTDKFGFNRVYKLEPAINI